MDIKDEFYEAVSESKSLKDNPSNDTLLQLYCLYKQATEGDITGEAPTRFDFVAKAKYDAWLSLKGMTMETAMKEYIELIRKLKE